MIDLQAEQQRLYRWGQTPQTRLSGVQMAPAFIERVGVATLYPASPEFPNLFSAYMGDPHAKTDAAWDSPSGEVYSWRWTLGQRSAAFYTALIRRRPTWICWSLLPAMLRLCGARHSPDELYEAGQLTASARCIVQTLEAAPGALATSELRAQAGFPRGSSSRVAYLKAVEELEAHLLVAKVFLSEDQSMHHTLVRKQYPDLVVAAARLSLDEALDQFLQVYLSQAVYATPSSLAQDLKLPSGAVSAAFERLMAVSQVVQIKRPKNVTGYLWCAPGAENTKV
jgi:hypothetical protein